MACKRSAVRSRVAPPNQQKARPCDGLFVYGRKSLLDGLALGTASSALAARLPFTLFFVWNIWLQLLLCRCSGETHQQPQSPLGTIFRVDSPMVGFDGSFGDG